VFDLAASSGLALMLSLQNHGPFSLAFNSEWAQNPYNAANGGPLEHPEQVFTDATAQELFRRRLRYCVARWSYAPHLLAWELWNEVDLTNAFAPAVVAAWHRDMAAYLRSIDPNRHLVSTSFSLYPSIVDTPDYARIVDDANLDFTQIHRYTTLGNGTVVGDSDVSHDTPRLTALMIREHARPTLVAEYGVNATDANTTATLDPDAIALHDALWSSALAGGFGAAMTWWWDTYIDATPDVVYPMFGALVAFVEGVAWDRERLSATTASVTSPTKRLEMHGLDGTGVRLGWIKNDDDQWNHRDRSVVTDAVCDIGGKRGQHWYAQWFDTTTGSVVAAQDIAPRDPATLPVPPFVGDIALRLRRGRLPARTR
jgi:hypothetical protein